MHRIHIARLAIGLTVAGSIAACFSDQNNDVLGPRPDDIFASYVAIGNSITAGFQSSGITDSTQRQSYAFLLAQQMRTRFAYASMRRFGCPAPINNFLTQGRPPGSVNAQGQPICFLRDSTTLGQTLNNVGVPGATSFDPNDPDGTTASNALTTFILGGRSQVQRALQADPTFVSVWIGNNDVLGPAISNGTTAALAAMTPLATYQTNMDATLNTLVAGAPGVKGILIGVVNAANAPIMFPASALQNAAFKTGFDGIAGVATTVDPSCGPTGAGASSVINTFLAFQIRQGAHPPIIACVPGGATGLLPPPVGDALVLHAAEQTTVGNLVAAYNNYLAAKAQALDFAYFDPNPLLLTLKTQNTLVRSVPTLGATGTFGTGMSLDGVHPALGVHREIANALIPVIEAKYNVDLDPVP